MKNYKTFVEIANEAFDNIESLEIYGDMNTTEAIKHIDAIEAQTEAAPLNINTIAAIVAAYPEAFYTIRRDADKIDIYHDKDTAQYFKQMFAAINTVLYANSVQRGAIDGGAYYILESGAIVRVYINGAFPRFA